MPNWRRPFLHSWPAASRRPGRPSPTPVPSMRAILGRRVLDLRLLDRRPEVGLVLAELQMLWEQHGAEIREAAGGAEPWVAEILRDQHLVMSVSFLECGTSRSRSFNSSMNCSRRRTMAALISSGLNAADFLAQEGDHPLALESGDVAMEVQPRLAATRRFEAPQLRQEVGSLELRS